MCVPCVCCHGGARVFACATGCWHASWKGFTSNVPQPASQSLLYLLTGNYYDGVFVCCRASPTHTQQTKTNTRTPDHAHAHAYTLVDNNHAHAYAHAHTLVDNHAQVSNSASSYPFLLPNSAPASMYTYAERVHAVLLLLDCSPQSSLARAFLQQRQCTSALLY